MRAWTLGIGRLLGAALLVALIEALLLRRVIGLHEQVVQPVLVSSLAFAERADAALVVTGRWAPLPHPLQGWIHSDDPDERYLPPVALGGLALVIGLIVTLNAGWMVPVAVAVAAGAALVVGAATAVLHEVIHLPAMPDLGAPRDLDQPHLLIQNRDGLPDDAFRPRF
jgi:hypothetical protein